MPGMDLVVRLLRWTWLVMGLVVIALNAAACSADAEDDEDPGMVEPGYRVVTVQSGQAIKIGISTILSGDLLSLGEPIAQAAELAGKAVTIRGFPVEFVRRDDLCTANGGASAAIQLIDANVVAVVGPTCSGGVVEAQPAYEHAGITHISPSATALVLTTPHGRPPFETFLRVTHNDRIQGKAQARFAHDKLHAQTAYVVYDADVYASGLRDSFDAAFEDAGGELAGAPEAYEKGQTDFGSIITNIGHTDPDLVYFAGFYAEAIPFIQQLRQAMPDVLFLAGDGVRDDEFLAGAGDDAEGAYLSLPSPVLEGSVFDDFAAAFQAAYGEAATDSPFTAESYDAAKIIINAIEEVATLDGSNLEIDLEELNQAIRDSSYDGAIGHIEFDEKGDNAGGETPVTLFRVEDGQFVTVE